MLPFGPEYCGHGSQSDAGGVTDDSVANHAQAPSKVLADGIAVPNRPENPLVPWLIFPAWLWLGCLVLLPACPLNYLPETKLFVAGVSTLVIAISIPALILPMRKWRIVCTLPLWAGILFCTIMICRHPACNSLEYVLRHTGQDEKEAFCALRDLGADVGPPDNDGHITIVQFDNLRAADDRLRFLKALPSLEILDMNGPGVTDSALTHLRNAKGLEFLELRLTQVSDPGLIQLKGLTNLKSLDLSGSQVTDAGMRHLEGLVGLRNLWLGGTKVTDEGRRKLRESLPNCGIHQ